MRTRELCKAQGRWIQVDPIWPGEKAYAYGLSAPTVWNDRWGLKVQKCWRRVVPGLGFQNISHWYFKTDKCGCPGFIRDKSGYSYVTDDCEKNRDDQQEKCETISGISDKQEECICNLTRNVMKGWRMCGVIWNGHYDLRDLNCQHFLNALMKKCTGDCLPGADWGDPSFDYDDCLGKSLVWIR